MSAKVVLSVQEKVALSRLCAAPFTVPVCAPVETVNHPKHYNMGRFEVIDVIEDWGLGFNDGNAVKYIARAKHKGSAIEDLKKAVWYLNRCIGQLEERRKDGQEGILSGTDGAGVHTDSGRRLVGPAKRIGKRRSVRSNPHR